MLPVVSVPMSVATAPLPKIALCIESNPLDSKTHKQLSLRLVLGDFATVMLALCADKGD